ncbi:MAG: hypothetical protein DSZ33_02355 [Gammaproteobacteria bacterium]|nr:MAG: hypothetical protein DSZ33_02355 [Gammaproteobacteria bacterium]
MHHLLLTLHILAFTVWVGGMFFAHMALRPAAQATLEPAQRLPLFSKVFDGFFPWVWVAVLLLVGTGYWLIFRMGSFANVGLNIHVMALIGDVMAVIFMFIFFSPYPKLRAAVSSGDLPEAGKQLARIRHMIAVNLALGLATIVVAVAGRLIL